MGNTWISVLICVVALQVLVGALPPTARLRQPRWSLCSDLSRAIGELLRHPSAAIGPRDLTPQQLRETVVHLTGLDLFDEQLRRDVTCYVSEGMGEMRTFLSLLEDKNIPYHAFRSAYDYFTTLSINEKYEIQFSIEYPVNGDPHQGVLIAEYDLIEAAEAAGVFSQDANGTQWVAEILGNLPEFLEQNDFQPMAYQPVDVQCRSLTHKVYKTWNTLKRILRDSNNEARVELYRNRVDAWTGLNLEDRVAVEEVLCDVLESIDSGGLEQLYQYLRDSGILNFAFRELYFTIIERINAIERYIDDVEERLADPEPGWNYKVQLSEEQQMSLQAIEGVFDILRQLGFMNMRDNLGPLISTRPT